MKVLVIAPHADDETLGCGGTLLHHKSNGDQLNIVVVTSIVNSKNKSPEKIKRHIDQRNKALASYDFENIFSLDILPTTLSYSMLPKLVSRLSDIHSEVKPEIIYMPFIKDVHTDHQIISAAIRPSLKWFRYPHVKKVLMYETISETEFNFIDRDNFHPNTFVNISKYIDQKIRIMEIYEDQMESFPFPRSSHALRSLASLRGCQSGYNAAEAFELVFQKS